MDTRDIAGRAGARGRTRVHLRAVALATAWLPALGCLGQPEPQPVDPPPPAPPARFVQVAYATASNAEALDYFGASVAVSGDRIVASAPWEASAATGIDGDQDDDRATHSGAVYAFQRGDAGWQQEAYIKPSFNRFEANNEWSAVAGFGETVAMSGDTLAVAAPFDRSVGWNTGGVYVFKRSDTGWKHETFLYDPDTSMFGAAMALDGDRLAIWAPCELAVDPPALPGPGDDLSGDEPPCPMLYVYRRGGTSWFEEDRFPYPDPEHPTPWYHDNYGARLALSGDTLAITAEWDGSGAAGIDGDPYDDSAEFSGAVYVYRRSDTGWYQEAYVKASNPEANDGFGKSLALSGDTLVVGAHAEDSGATGIDGDQHDNSASRSGAVYVFRRSGTTWQQEAYLKSSRSSEEDELGLAVALDGDTLAVTSFAHGLDHPGQGAVFMFHRGDQGWQEEPHVVVASEPSRGGTFRRLALAGDTLVVGVPHDGTELAPDAESGAIYVFQRVRE